MDNKMPNENFLNPHLYYKSETQNSKNETNEV
jgi:hypothetical protein